MAKANESPRAIIHKRILEEATENPEAAVEELADGVSGASARLVEQILETYGDPGETENPTQVVNEPMNESDIPISPTELSDEQRATLETIIERPDATQREIAEHLGVAAATVSQRLGTIDGFDWEDRGRIVAQIKEMDVFSTDETTDESSETNDASQAKMMDSEVTTTATAGEEESGKTEADESKTEASPDHSLEEINAEIEQLQSRMTDLEATVETTAETLATDIEEQITDGGHRSSLIEFEDATLVAKLVRAAVADESVTEDEEVRIIEALV